MNALHRILVASMIAISPALAQAFPAATIHDASMAEGNSGTTNMVFSVTLSASQAVAATVNYTTVDGTALAGSDYTAKSGTLTIPAGQTSASISVPIIGDTVPEPTETFTVKLSGNHNLTIADGNATGTIVNDDGPTLTISDGSVAEGNGPCDPINKVAFTVSLSQATTNDVDFNYSLASDTTGAYPATYGQNQCADLRVDFEHPVNNLAHVVIPAGQTSAQILVPVYMDTTPEFNETFLVNLSSINNAVPIRTQAVGTIINDDGLAIAVNSVSTTEGNSGTKNLTFTVSLSQSSASSVSVNYATADGTAIAGTDYVAKSGTLTIPFGQTNATVSVQVKGNTKPEPDKTFYLNLSSPVNGALYIPQGKGTIVNDDGLNISIAPTMSFNEGASGSGTSHITVTQSAVSASDTTFHYATANGTATAPSDYTAASGTATIPAGQTTVQIPFVTLGDKVAEASETFYINLSSPTNAAIDVGQAAITLLNDDGPKLTLQGSTIVEGNVGTTMQPFQLTLSAPAIGDVKVTYTAIDANTHGCQLNALTAAKAGVDYVATTGTATITTGHTTTTINIPVIGNTVAETSKSFCLLLGSNADYAVVDPNAISYPPSGIILNDDGPLVSISDASVTEGNSSTRKLTFVVTASEPVTRTANIGVLLTDGTATYGSDYTYGTSIYLNAGESTATFFVNVIGDTVPEANETFTVDLQSYPEYVRIGHGHAVGTIVNDDGPALSIGDASTVEGNSGTHTVSFPVTLSQALSSDVTFQYYTADGTATAGSDYVQKNLTTVTIPAGTTTQQILVTVNGDATPESDETFLVNIGNATGATIVRPQATGTIVDDDNTPTLSIADSSITEGNSGTQQMGFNVTLSHPWTSAVTFKFVTSDGTATAGSDYVAKASTLVTIPAGNVKKTVFVTVNGDTTPENDETFNVTLINPNGATFARAQAVGTILDDDVGTMAIAAVQGAGDTSPVLGRTVKVTGIVTARTGEGFMLQTPDGQQDADARTSEGLFVSTGKTAYPQVVVGARAQVTGVVQEAVRGHPIAQLTMTQVAATSVKVLATNQALPQPVVLAAMPSNTVDAWERYEGMRVSIPALSVVGPASGSVDANGASHLDGRFYGVLRGTARPFREAGLDALDRNAFVAGMQRFDGNPERLMVDSRAQAGAGTLTADAGDTVTGLTGVLAYGDGAYQIWPDRTAATKVIAAAAQRPVPAGGAYTIGQFHLGLLVPTAVNYSKRLAKTANAICAYTRSPAILGLQDAASGKVLADVAAAVNGQAGNALFPKACAGNPAYQVVGSGNNGLGFLVSAAPVWQGKPRVEVVASAPLGQGTQFRHADGSVESLYAATPMLLQARLNAKDGDALEVTIVQASLQPVEGIDADAPGKHGWKNQGAYLDAKRQAQALWLANWLQARQASHPTEKLVVLGGFNAYAFNDGHSDLVGLLSGQPTTARTLQTATSPLHPALANLTATVPAGQRYDRIWQGNAEATDHILVNHALLDGSFKLRVDHARLNADFGIDNDDDFSVPMHTSTQDPTVLSLDRR